MQQKTQRRGEELQIPWIKTSPSIPWILTNWTTTIKNPLPQLPTLLLLLLKLSDNQNGIPGMIKFWSSKRGYVSIWHLVQVTKSSTSFHFPLSALRLYYQSWFMFLLTFFLNEISVCFMCLSLIKRIDLIWPLNSTKNNHQHFVHKKCWNDKNLLGVVLSINQILLKGSKTYVLSVCFIDSVFRLLVGEGSEGKLLDLFIDLLGIFVNTTLLKN